MHRYERYMEVEWVSLILYPRCEVVRMGMNDVVVGEEPAALTATS
jgi:hypothetical protein